MSGRSAAVINYIIRRIGYGVLILIGVNLFTFVLFFTVNTPGTKAVVGFAGGKELTLGGVKVEPACRFASLFLTALDRDVDIVIRRKPKSRKIGRIAVTAA